MTFIEMKTPSGALVEVRQNPSGSFSNWYVSGSLARPDTGRASSSAFFTVREAAIAAMEWIADAAEEMDQ